MKLRFHFPATIFLLLTIATTNADPHKPKVVTEFAVNLGGDGPEGVAYDAHNGHFYFVAGSTIYQTDRKGGNKKRIGQAAGARYRGITRTGAGHFFALDASSSKIHVYDSEGKIRETIQLPESPSYRAISRSEDGGTIYVSDRNKIVVLDADGKQTGVIVIPDGDIQGIAATSTGGLWVVDDETLVVTLLDKTGKKQQEIALKGLTEHVDPEGLWLDYKGKNLYVSGSSGILMHGFGIERSVE